MEADAAGVEVEVCVEDAAGVRAARAAGARRVELCSALSEGGLTPSLGAVRAALAVGGIEVVVLVRPRGGDFLYGEDELGVMEDDVTTALESGAAGVALGCLEPDGTIDERATARLLARAGPGRVTFHRAFDHVRDPRLGLEVLVRLGIARVLTSGQAASALEGRAQLAALVQAARGRLAVVAAGGVRAAHARELVRASGVRHLHLAASRRVESAMRHRNPHPRLVSAARASEPWAHHATSTEEVAALLASLRGTGAGERWT